MRHRGIERSKNRTLVDSVIRDRVRVRVRVRLRLRLMLRLRIRVGIRVSVRLRLGRGSGWISSCGHIIMSISRLDLSYSGGINRLKRTSRGA